jgi:hypothetical protein
MPNLYKHTYVTNDSMHDIDNSFYQENKDQQQDFSYLNIPFTEIETSEEHLEYDYLSNEVFRIIKPTIAKSEEIKSKKIKEQLSSVVTWIIGALVKIQNIKKSIDLSRIPELSATMLPDKSLLVEWIFPKYRIGFALENNPKQSSWYLVSAIEKAEMNNMSGMLGKGDKSTLVSNLVTFVLRNS